MSWEILELVYPGLDDRIKNKITTFYQLLITENKKYNLTRITDWNELLTKHVLDSLAFSEKVDLNRQKILDIGSGAGFPGIVLKLFYPHLDVTLVEANQKKANFLKMVIKELKLTNIRVVSQRVEDYALNNRGQFDLVVSRAVAPLRILLELGAPLLKKEGFLIALKGPQAQNEKILVANLDQALGLIYHQSQVNNYDYGKRINLFYQKINETPLKYPRAYRVIKKEFDTLRKK